MYVEVHKWLISHILSLQTIQNDDLKWTYFSYRGTI